MRSTRASAIGLTLAVLASWLWRLPQGPAAGTLNLDVDLQFYPYYEETYRRIAAGVLPTWNPYPLCGVPWLAILQGGFFHPLHAVYLVLPLHWGLAISHLVHLPLAALATAAFARRAGLSGAAALLAAVLFTMRGMFPLSLAAVPYFEATAWLPVGALAVWWLADGALRRGAALLATAAAMSFLAGYPQPTTYMLVAWGTLAVAAAVTTGTPRWPLVFGACVGALGLGAAAAGAQLVPGLELVWDGAHGNLSPEAMAPYGLSPAAEILTRSAIAGSAFSWGVTALALALTAAVAEQRRALAWWAIGMTGLTIVFALGDRTPLFPLYRAVPLLGSFRFPDRLLGITDFVLAIAAAVGLDAVTRAAGTRRRTAPVVALIATAALAAVGRVWGAPPTAQATIAVAALAAGTLLVAAAVWHVRAAAAALVVVAAGEALAAPWQHLVTYTARTVERYGTFADAYRAVAVRAGEDRTWFASGIKALQPEHALKLATRYRVRTIDDYEPLAPRRQAQYFTYLGEGTPEYRRPPWLFAGQLTTLAPPDGVAPPATRRRLLDLAAVRFVVVPAGARGARPDLDALLRDGGFAARSFVDARLELFENPHVLPRAFVVYRTRRAPEPEALLAALARPDFDPLVESYVEDDPGFDTSTDAPRGAPARIAVDEEDVVEVEATLSRPGLVVLADAFYPGWRVTVDGVSARIVPTNHLFRGVPTAAGTHRIRFEYRPLSVSIGIGVSVLGWLAIAGLAWRARGRGAPHDVPADRQATGRPRDG